MLYRCTSLLQAYLTVTVTVRDFNDPPTFSQDATTLSILAVYNYVQLKYIWLETNARWVGEKYR